jgi:DNA repair protein RadC
MPVPKAPDASAGHRRRLRQKFLRAGLNSLNNYEIIELLLTLGTPRTDCKERAKEAIRRFKGLRGVLEATRQELKQIKGIGPDNAIGILLVREVANAYLQEKARELPVCGSSKAVYDYLYHSMQGLKKEVFRVLFLNSQNQLIGEEELSRGTVNMSAVFVREVIEAALNNKAAAIICVHNHPSGNPCPSKEDRDITRELSEATRLVQISLQDHIIIGDSRYFSFAGEGLIRS